MSKKKQKKKVSILTETDKTLNELYAATQKDVENLQLKLYALLIRFFL